MERNVVNDFHIFLKKREKTDSFTLNPPLFLSMNDQLEAIENRQKDWKSKKGGWNEEKYHPG